MKITFKRGKSMVILEPHQITMKVVTRKLGDTKC